MILVVDVGTTGLRVAALRSDASVADVEYRPFPPDSPFPGLVEFDAAAMGALVLETAATVIDGLDGAPIDAVGVATQRASTILWDRSTGEPVGPGLGWQDLRTVGECLTARAEHGLRLAPNQSATKIGWLLANAAGDRDPSELCFGTVDAWIAWTLTEGRSHVTDHTNAAVTGLYSMAERAWNHDTCELLGVDPAMLPAIVDTAGVVAECTALPGAPPLAALAGDQQASLVGQGCLERGQAKITFGTGAMLDMTTGRDAPNGDERSDHGTFPIVAWTQAGEAHWGVEAIMLSAGTNVEWLCDDLGVIETPAASHEIAQQCSSAEGVVYVPALLGLGTPAWDYGARGTLLGLTRGSERSHVVRAVLEGVAHRGADLVEAAEADTGTTIPTLRIDGGMSRNPTFVQALADASGKPVEVAPVVESTMVGAGLLAGTAVGVWPDLAAASDTFEPDAIVQPGERLDRETWGRAVERARDWFPDLSALDF